MLDNSLKVIFSDWDVGTFGHLSLFFIEILSNVLFTFDVSQVPHWNPESLSVELCHLLRYVQQLESQWEHQEEVGSASGRR